MIVDFDGEGEKWREARLIRVFCALGQGNRIKVRKLQDREGHLSVYAEFVDALFCASIQAAWEEEVEWSFDVFDITNPSAEKLRFTSND